MQLLLVAATPGETALLRQAWPWEQVSPHRFRSQRGPYRLELLHTGIGMVNTAWSLGRYTAQGPAFDRAINLGIAGSYDHSLPLGSVVECQSDCFAELGADSPRGFLGLKELGFALHEDEQGPWYNGLVNPAPWGQGLLVKAITVNTVQGSEPSLSQMQARWQAQVETMEGAAFFYAMRRLGLPFYAFRSLSNYVEPRNRTAWQIGLALRRLTDFLVAGLEAEDF